MAATAQSATQFLPQVTVSASADEGEAPPPYAGGQVARGGRLGMLGDTTIMNAPFNLTSYTSELIQNQLSATVAEALSKDPSVRSTGLAGGNIDTYYIRGFPINEGNSGEIAFTTHPAAPSRLRQACRCRRRRTAVAMSRSRGSTRRVARKRCCFVPSMTSTTR